MTNHGLRPRIGPDNNNKVRHLRRVEEPIMRLLPLILTALLVTGCASWLATDSESDLTVAAVQRHIYLGMSGAEVATVLGSPNIVTTDQLRNETWIYDRFSSERVQTNSPDPLTLLQSLIDTGSVSNPARVQSELKSQKTLTIIIKFDADARVSDFAYHTSRF